MNIKGKQTPVRNGVSCTVEFREQLSLISPISELVGRVKLNWLEESSERKTRECEEKKKKREKQHKWVAAKAKKE